MKKRFTSILCILAMLIGIIQPLGAFASDFGASIDFVSVVCDQNRIYFDVGVDGKDALLTVALYNDDGDLIEMRNKNTRFGYGVSLDFTQDANSYKVMLLDNNNKLKPLCSAEDGLTIDVPEYTDNYEGNASFVSGLEIISAKHSEFDKERAMTRAEFANVLCRMLDVVDVAGAFTQDNIYTDVASNHWASGCINLLGQSGIIDTIEDGKFNPDDAVSYAHAVSALVRCLGYEPVAEELGGYESIASDLKITLGVNAEDLRAKDIVNMVSNALKAPMLDANSFNPESADDYFVSDGKNGRAYKTLLTDMSVYKATGVIDYVFGGEMGFVVTEDSMDCEFEEGDEVYFETDDNSLIECSYELADVYVKKDEFKNYAVKAVEINENCKTLTILSDDVVDHSQSIIKYTNDGETKVADIDIENSRLNSVNAGLNEIIQDRDVIIKLIDNTCDGIYDAIWATRYDYYTVTGIDVRRDIIQLDGSNAYLDNEDASIVLCDDNGNKLTIDEFNENDIVAVACDRGTLRNSNYIKIVKLTGGAKKGTVEGFIEGERYDYAVIDGKNYVNMSDTRLEEGETYTFRLGLTGKIVFADIYDGIDSPSASVGAYTLSASGSGSVVGGSQSGTTLPSVTVPAPSEQHLQNAKMLISFGILTDVPNANDEITRADFANLLCRAMNLESEAQGYKDKNKFNDIDAQHYASGAINLLAEKGIVGALTGNNFCPDTAIRYAHAIRYAVNALGYSPMANIKGGYPLGYVKTAKSLDALAGIECDYHLDGEMLAGFANNILEICHMEETLDGGYVILDGKGTRDYRTFLTRRGIYTPTGIITAITEDAVTFEVQEASKDNNFRQGTYTFAIDDYNALDYLYMYADAYVKKTADGKYKLLATSANSMDTSIVINSNQIDYWGTDDRYLEYCIDLENSGETATIRHNITTDDILYNMQTGRVGITELYELYDLKVVLIENTGDNTYDKAVVTKYMHGFVDFVDTENNIISVNGREYEFYPESQNIIELFADEDGKKVSLSHFEEGDFVAVASNRDIFTMVQDLSGSKITGFVDERYQAMGEEYAVINETVYCISEEMETEINVGDKGHFYIGKTGKIEAFEPDMSDVGLGYIVGAQVSDSSFSLDKWQVELVTDKNGFDTFDVTDDVDEQFEKYFKNNPAFTIEDDKCLFENATQEQKTNPARIITYKLNAKGQIKSFETLETSGTVTVENSEYDKDTKALSGAVLEDDAIVIDVLGGLVSDISCLRSGAKYSGCVLKDAKGKNSVVIITAADMQSVEKGDLAGTPTSFAIARTVTNTQNGVIIDYYCNGEEGKAIFSDLSLMQGDVHFEDITLGSVFSFIADNSGNVTDYAVIATMAFGDFRLSQEGIDAVSDADTEFVHGYISNEKRITNAKGELIEIDHKDTFLVSNTTTNRYTFDDSGRNIVIRNGDFMDHLDMDYYDEDYGYTSRVLIKIVDGMVTDIYGFYDHKKN